MRETGFVLCVKKSASETCSQVSRCNWEVQVGRTFLDNLWAFSKMGWMARHGLCFPIAINRLD